MFKTAIIVGLMLTPAVVSAQLGAGMGTDAYAHGHTADLDPVSGAAGTPMHKSHVEHYQAQQAVPASAPASDTATATGAVSPR